ncbi:MAG: phosphoribosylformylglycinamidine synthase subunit PurQ [Bacteroidales bacterium]|nr:phosphoribosylformylglycinamidine synthase subunit PurQ [Bacteroidales bacterium]
MKFGIVRFPESTCYFDTRYVLSEILEQEVYEVWHQDTKINKIDALIIPGGSFDIGTRKKSPIISEIRKFAKIGGFVLATGFGFELLCKIGLLPGELQLNENQKFCSKNIFIKPKHTYSALTALQDSNFAYKIPIAEKYGKFEASDKIIKEMRENEQILFQYCTEDGHLTEHANPTGSRANIAGICNAAKNVYGMVPLPERAADDELGNTDGSLIFESIIAYLK